MNLNWLPARKWLQKSCEPILNKKEPQIVKLYENGAFLARNFPGK